MDDGFFESANIFKNIFLVKNGADFEVEQIQIDYSGN